MKERRLWFWKAVLLAVTGLSIAGQDLSRRSNAEPRKITVSTKDSLRLRKGVYASILFKAENGAQSRVPAQYRFSQSGHVPPGMIFESYPCNKPGKSVCPQLASADGIYLDGVPIGTGSYRVTIVASGPDRSQGSRAFTVVVLSH